MLSFFLLWLQDVRVETRETTTHSEASPGRWGGIIPLAVVGTGAGMAALDETNEDRVDMAGVAVAYLSMAFVVYYVPIACEGDETETLPPRRIVGPPTHQACAPPEPFANANVILVLHTGERRQGTTSGHGTVRFEGLSPESVRGVLIDGVHVKPDVR